MLRSHPIGGELSIYQERIVKAPDENEYRERPATFNRFESLVGSLLCVSRCSRQDISYVAYQVSKQTWSSSLGDYKLAEQAAIYNKVRNIATKMNGQIQNVIKKVGNGWSNPYWRETSVVYGKEKSVCRFQSLKPSLWRVFCGRVYPWNMFITSLIRLKRKEPMIINVANQTVL